MSEYSLSQKLLHYLVLENYVFRKFSFQLENFLIRYKRKKCNIGKSKHVFIIGMPRSGTTILLKFLYESDDFASLTYKDMPFILSPNLWSFFSKKKKLKLKSRIHDDGIVHSLDSPEAFEEIFWETFKEENLKTNYISYIKTILNRYNKTRYLCKNNYNYKRITIIKSILPNSIFLIPIRDPYLTAYSLLIQHKKFKKLQSENTFLRKYMHWLGHHEFGLDHKPWFKVKKYCNLSSVNYWLEQWFLYHTYLLENHGGKKNIFFIDHKKLISKNYSKSILKLLRVSIRDNFVFFNVRHNKINSLDLNLYKKCNALKKKLLEKSSKFLI